jgi:quinol monooxygenase YgiN
MEKDITIVLAFLRAKPGDEGRVHEELSKVVTETLKEPGCLGFVAHQSAERPTEFVVYEHWRERDDVDLHIAMPHVQQFMKLGESIFAEPVRVTFWNSLEPA